GNRKEAPVAFAEVAVYFSREEWQAVMLETPVTNPGKRIFLTCTRRCQVCRGIFHQGGISSKRSFSCGSQP
uniref:KRAB domain-containing protein n=1 Tax=Meleagris gallopavo TaxID=9103 RepID=A0A803XU36_MELGA